LDERGWAEIDEIIERAGFRLTRDMIDEAVLKDNKDRFKIDGDRIRASQGHSIDVDLELVEKEPPEYLYHGAPKRKMKLIWEDGLKKMGRNHVHLSVSVEEAIKVGRRYHDRTTVVLRVSTGLMYQEGYRFYLSDNEVWLTDKVPSRFLRLHDQVE
jgi:putative RNA 2'-phosphotransferase